MEITKSVMAERVQATKDGFVTENDIHQIGSDTFPFQHPKLSVGLMLSLKPHEMKQTFELTFFIEGPSGNKIPFAPVEEKMLHEVIIKARPADMMERYEQNTSIGMEFQYIKIPEAGLYNFVVQIDGKGACEMPLRVVDYTEMQSVQGLEVLNVLLAHDVRGYFKSL